MIELRLTREQADALWECLQHYTEAHGPLLSATMRLASVLDFADEPVTEQP